MAQADRQQPTTVKVVLANVRLTTTERAHLRRVALDRCISMSDVMREALRNNGALPPE